MMQRILCPTDLTDKSRDGVACAIRLARENSAELIIFHATSFPTANLYTDELLPYSHWERLISEFRMDQVLQTAARRVKNFVESQFRTEIADIAWRPEVAVGKLAEEVVAIAVGEQVSLIVMARNNKGLLARIFSANTHEAVIRSAPCPVLSVDTEQGSDSSGWRLPLLKEVFQNS
jgi:nucleotide-binding universal stress UspA family protein